MDLIVQTSTQSHCHRIAKYFKSRQQQHVFPPGPFADSAEETGPLQSHTNGPCLLQFSNMQLTPQQFNAWFSGHFIERPCCRLYWLQRSIPAEPDKESMFKAILAAGIPEGMTAVRLDGFPKSGEIPLGDELLDLGYPGFMHPTAYSHVLFLVHMPDTGLWRWSYMEREHLWRNACDEPPRFSKSVATAINKIAEAMQVLGLAQQPAPQQSNRLTASNGLQEQQQQQDHIQQQLQQLQLTPSAQTNGAAHQQQQQQQQQQQPPPPKRWAIDLGAAPGGWTSYLADSCGYNVIAIDPAELHPDVVARPGVHHIRAKAADAMERVEQLLQGQQVELLVCDANDHVTCLPKFLGPVLPKLRSGGSMVLTLKYYGRGPKGDDVTVKMASLLPGLEAGTVLWLMANTLCERTYVTKKN